MTREEAISELQYAQAMCEFNPSTGKFEFCNEKDKKQYEAFGIAIEALQADTVEVVRCKDCKHNNNTCRNHGKMEPMCDFTRKKLKEMDFCSYGERNEK